MQTKRMIALGLGFAGLLCACSDVSGPGNSGNVTVTFAQAAADPFVLNGMVAADLPLEADNGTLTLDEIWLVADEFKLQRADGACEDPGDGQNDDDCKQFELPPFFVSVPQVGDNIGEVTADVAPGTYRALKFETKAPDGESDLFAEIRASHFGDWPGQASMVVVGTFTPPDEEAVSFRAYFDAEVKVELAFADEEPLVVEEGSDLSVTVFVDPAIWFVNDDGTVVDLRQYDYDMTGEVFKFEAKFGDAFTKIEIDE